MLIAQITDTHITVDGRQAGDLSATMTAIAALRPRPDAVLISGDLTNNARLDQYARLRDILAGCEIELFVVPGNHDDRAALRATLPERYYPGVEGQHLIYALDAPELRIVGLDTTEPRRPGGILDAARLARLEALLGAAPERPALIFMHHPPFRTGVNLADVFGFEGLRAFRRIITRHPQVRRIICGHIHCERATTIAQARVTTSLSSTPQRVPEVFERRLIGLRPEPAGFTLHAWRDGAFATITYVASGGGVFVTRPSTVSR